MTPEQLHDFKFALQCLHDGLLATGLRKLEEAGYIAIDKSFLARKPLTRARLTAALIT